MIRRTAQRFRFMREHRWTHAHLSQYLDRELQAAERERVAEHVGLCPDCHRVLATLRRTVESIRAIGAKPDEPEVLGESKLAGGVIERLRKEA